MRADVVVFCVHATVTAPDPLPLVGLTVSHDPFPDADQPPPTQPAGCPVTVTPVAPAAAPGALPDELNVKLVHVGGIAPACVTLKLCPAIVATPVRADVVVFCVHATVTAPDPLPLVGLTVSHDPFPDADQPPPTQPAGCPVTVTPVAPAVAPGALPDELNVKLVHVGGVAPACVTLKLCPAIVATPVRADVVVFCVHATVTAPDPLPLVGLTVSHDPFPDADQPPPTQPAGCPVTVTPVAPAAAPGALPDELNVKLVHVGGIAPACVTLKLCPAIVATPVRADVVVFCVHATVTAPDPLPLVGLTVSHDPFPDADQPPPTQPAGCPVTVTPVAPAAAPGALPDELNVKLVHVGGGDADEAIEKL